MSEALLKRVAQGDEEAVAACIDRYGALVWRIARRLAPDADDAADTVQEAFLDLWSRADAFDPRRGNEAAFVATIARRRAIDRWRKAKRQPVAVELDQVSTRIGADAPDHLEHKDEADRALGALRALAPDQQQMLYLAVHAGWPHSRIAEHLGRPLGTVKSLIRRGLLEVRKTLERTQTAPQGGPVS